jgi:hypothetical protein
LLIIQNFGRLENFDLSTFFGFHLKLLSQKRLFTQIERTSKEWKILSYIFRNIMFGSKIFQWQQTLFVRPKSGKNKTANEMTAFFQNLLPIVLRMKQNNKSIVSTTLPIHNGTGRVRALVSDESHLYSCAASIQWFCGSPQEWPRRVWCRAQQWAHYFPAPFLTLLVGPLSALAPQSQFLHINVQAKKNSRF